MTLGKYKKVIKKGHYIQCDHCGNITLALRGELGWWRYMYDKKNNYFADIENSRPYGRPGWRITEETVVCPNCYETVKLASELRDLSIEDISSLKTMLKELKNGEKK